ncbi:hypothetical protein AJ87_25295 [Rhizobium yanglingense]|nr:hypothetical protein AJ87_25295 [Rhizobium yanglingense]
MLQPDRRIGDLGQMLCHDVDRDFRQIGRNSVQFHQIGKCRDVFSRAIQRFSLYWQCFHVVVDATQTLASSCHAVRTMIDSAL